MAIKQVPQGTTVGTPEIGTLNGPKQAPTTTQYGGSESVPTTQSTVVQERGWPTNPGYFIGGSSGTREHIQTTDYELQSGPAPARILRAMFARIFGFVGDGPIASFPFNADMSLIPHIPVPRRAQGTGPLRRTYDDAAQIPAVYAGNPRVR